MDTLIELLQEILAEKNRISPNDIRYGKTVFGIKGLLLSSPITAEEKIIKEDETADVKTKYLNIDLEEETVAENKITTNKFPLYLDVTVNNVLLKKNEVIDIVKDSIININVPKINMLSGKFSENDDLEGNIEHTKTESETAPIIEEREVDEGTVLHTDGTSWVKYDLTSPMTDFILEFEFFKADASPYPRVVGLAGLDFEIEIKGASNSLYWGQEFGGGWKQSEWNKLKFVKSGTNVELYINDILIAIKTYETDLTGFYIGRGNATDNFFNGYYRNLILRDPKEVTVEVTDKGGEV